MKIHKPLLAKYALFALAMGATLNVGAEDSHLTTDAGAPVGDNQNSQTAGPSGPATVSIATGPPLLQTAGGGAGPSGPGTRRT